MTTLAVQIGGEFRLGIEVEQVSDGVRSSARWAVRPRHPDDDTVPVVAVREGMLIQEPVGWGEFCPFRQYDDRAAAALSTTERTCSITTCGTLSSIHRRKDDHAKASVLEREHG